jgi:hypothetical protein
MAGSSKKASPKSPKRKRQGKAGASETESASKSPKRTRQGKATVGSGNFNNEDYNIRSPERTELLTKIKGIINNTLVSPAFWACCQLADMNCLQELTEWKKLAILFTQKQLCAVPMQCELLGFCI